MFGIHDFGVFVVSCLVLNVTPGPDTFYILGRGMAQGRAAGVASALGIGTGALVHTLAAACGLSALVAGSAAAFTAVKWAGALYLTYLGLRMMLTRAPVAEGDASDTAAAGLGAGLRTRFESAGFAAVYRQGLLTNVLNPKVALFFLAFMPQFIGTQGPGANAFGAFLLLGLTFVTTGTLWCLGLAWMAAEIGARLRTNARLGTVLNRAAGALFVGLGLKLATGHGR